MYALKALLLTAILGKILSQAVSDNVVLKDLTTYLGLSGSYDTVQSAITNSSAPFSCNQVPIPSTSSSKYDTDTGYQACGWEIAVIKIACTNNKLAGLQLTLRNVNNPNLVQSTTQLSATATKTYNIPKDVYITKLTTGTSMSLNRVYVVSLVFDLSNGTSAKMTCFTPSSVNAISFTALERINGFYGTTYYGGFTYLGFYKHNIAPKVASLPTGSIANYYDLMRSDTTKTYSSAGDNFIRVGPYGNKTGKLFEDPYLYGHWDISQIALTVTANTIVSMQSFITNNFFYYLQTTELHGNKRPDQSKIINVNVPASNCITSVEFVVDKNSNLIGLAFYFSNSTGSGYLGAAPNQASGYTSIKYVVPANQEIIGFFGYDNEVSVLALGLLVVEQNDSQFYYGKGA